MDGALQRPTAKMNDLKGHLDALAETYHRAEHLEQDPLRFPRRYDDPADQEVTGLIAASLAFGNVRAFMAKCEEVLARLGPRPSRFLSDSDDNAIRERVQGFCYRFVGSAELFALLAGIARLLRRDGGLKASFLRGFQRDGQVIAGLSTLAQDLRTLGGDDTSARSFLTPIPSAAHASKRLLLFLRWMVRRDALDLGLWREVPRSALLIPLDVHVFRVAQFLGLLRPARGGPRLSHAIALTDALRRFDPEDPVRYDFALSHLGISRACKGRFDAESCAACALRAVCIEVRRPSEARCRDGG